MVKSVYRCGPTFVFAVPQKPLALLLDILLSLHTYKYIYCLPGAQYKIFHTNKQKGNTDTVIGNVRQEMMFEAQSGRQEKLISGETDYCVPEPPAENWRRYTAVNDWQKGICLYYPFFFSRDYSVSTFLPGGIFTRCRCVW